MTSLAAEYLRQGVAPPPLERALSITVLSGGPSAEREVSLKSGAAVARALQAIGHEVELSDISPSNLDALDVPMDVAFIALHGEFGEDGQLQQILDHRGIRYCGSGAAASAMAMDKIAAKRRFIEAGVPTPRFDVVTRERRSQILKLWSAPAVVKPISEGSSVDCTIVRDGAELPDVIEKTTERYGQCLIEEYIAGHEITVGILGENALPPIEIRPHRAFYDYHAKYLDDATEYLLDIPLPATMLESLRRLSLRAHKALGCRDFSRVDWMVDGETGEPFALEVNTIPGFTDHSLLPKAARAAGMSFSALCQRIVELACAR
jgi:D-alanine-D-alanine ligase